MGGGSDTGMETGGIVADSEVLEDDVPTMDAASDAVRLEVPPVDAETCAARMACAGCRGWGLGADIADAGSCTDGGGVANVEGETDRLSEVDGRLSPAKIMGESAAVKSRRERGDR
jgi:hypothetical protein